MIDMLSWFDTVIQWMSEGKIGVIFLIVFIGIALLNAIVTVLKSLLPKTFESVPISHKIAVLGLPSAGKTTLITALFDLIQRGVFLKRAQLHGHETIKRVNQNISYLNSGEKIPPTKERDIFVFKFSYERPGSFAPRIYDVEIADFPGEYTGQIEADSITQQAQDDELEFTLFKKKISSRGSHLLDNTCF